MISEILKPVDYYRKNKQIFNKKYNKIWKKIAGPKYIGYTSYLFQDFMYKWNGKDVPTYDDFAEYYFSNINTNSEYPYVRKDDCVNYGRTLDQIVRLSELYMELCEDYSIPLERYFDDVINHVIIETYDGQIHEINAIKEYEKHGFIVEHTSGRWDNELGVDFIVKSSEGVIVDYIQCKPISTFIGNNNPSLVNDRKNFYHKEQLKKNECNLMNLPYYETKFIIYDVTQPDKWLSLNGKRSFYLNELCDKNGIALHQIDDFVYVL